MPDVLRLSAYNTVGPVSEARREMHLTLIKRLIKSQGLLLPEEG